MLEPHDELALAYLASEDTIATRWDCAHQHAAERKHPQADAATQLESMHCEVFDLLERVHALPPAIEIPDEAAETVPDTGSATPSATGTVTPSLSPRKQKKYADLAEAQRALRGAGLRPGDWDARLYYKLRKQFLDEGRLDAISGLTAIAAQATAQALEAGEYRLPHSRTCEVQLPNRAHVQWFGSDNVPELQDEIASHEVPPVIASHMRLLDAVKCMTKMYPQHLLCASFDATDFTADGKALLGTLESRSFAQQELFTRTNFEYSSRRAPFFCKQSTMQEHLTCSSDPYVCVANEVVVFRGAPEQGYPFLPTDEHITFNLIVNGRHSARPLMTGKGGSEYFALQEDMVCCMDRLNLIAQGALAVTEQDRNYLGGEAKVPSSHKKPVLVIGLQDLTVAAHQQPRHSIATALKSWRLQYADEFEAVVLACGDKPTALIMDNTVNGPLYASALNGCTKTAMSWHWDEALLRLSVSPVLLSIKERVELIRCARSAAGTSKAGSEAGGLKSRDELAQTGEQPSLDSSRRGSTSRRMSAAYAQQATIMEVNHRVEIGAGSQNSGQSPWQSQPQSPRDDGPSPRRQSMAAQRSGALHAGMGEDPSHGTPRRMSSEPLGKRMSVQPEKPSTCSSREQFQRSLANRLQDSYVHDPQADIKRKEEFQNPENEIQANAGAKRALAVGVFMDTGKEATKKKAAESRKKQEALARSAKSLGMNDQVMAAVGVEEGMNYKDEFEVEEEKYEQELLDSVLSLASSLDTRLANRKKVTGT